MSETSQAKLAALLRRAGAAHGEYETSELGGVYDREWPSWYARYLVAHDIGDQLGRAIDAAALAELLVRCDQEHRQENPAMAWPEDYARRLLATAG